MGWLGTALILTGSWMLGYKCRAGFLVTTFGGLFWAAEAVIIERPDLLTIEIAMSYIGLRNYFKWGKRGSDV